MAEIIVSGRCRSDKIATRLAAAGIQALVRSSGGEITDGGHVATSHVIVVSDEQRVSAQAILDAFDPVAAQAEVEAEEAAEKTRAEKLRTLAEWLRTQQENVREQFQDVQAEVATNRAIGLEIVKHLKHVETALAAKGYTPLPWELPK